MLPTSAFSAWTAINSVTLPGVFPWPRPQMASGFDAWANVLANAAMTALSTPVISDTFSGLYDSRTTVLKPLY